MCRKSFHTTHLWITFTETDNSWVLIHIQQVYGDVTLQRIFIFKLHVYVSNMGSRALFIIRRGTRGCNPWGLLMSRPGAAGCRWLSAPREWGCSWRRPGRGWTCRWCWRRAQQRRLCSTERSAGTAHGPAGLWPAVAPALPWKETIWFVLNFVLKQSFS